MRTFLKQLSAGLVLKVLASISVYLLHIWLTKNLTIEEYARASTVLNIFTIGSVALCFGLDKLILRETSITFAKNYVIILKLEELRRLITGIGLIALISFFVLWSATDVIPKLVHPSFFVLLPFLTLVQLIVGVIRGIGLSTLSIFLQSTFLQVSMLTMSVLFVTSLNIFFIILGTCIVANTVVSIYLFQRKVRIAKSTNDNIFLKREFLGDIGYFGFGFLAIQATPIVSQLILVNLSNLADLGIFNLSIKIASCLGFILMAGNIVISPSFAKNSIQGVSSELKNTFLMSLKVFVVLAFVVGLPLVIFAQPILSFFGEKYSEGVLILRLIVIAQMINLCCGSVGPFLNMTGYHKIEFYLSLISALLGLVLLQLLVPEIGAVGCAISFVVSLCLRNLLGMCAVWIVLQKRMLSDQKADDYQ